MYLYMKRCNIFFNNFIKTRIQKNEGACRRLFDIIKYTGLIRGLLHNNSVNEIEMQGGKKKRNISIKVNIIYLIILSHFNISR